LLEVDGRTISVAYVSEGGSKAETIAVLADDIQDDVIGVIGGAWTDAHPRSGSFLRLARRTPIVWARACPPATSTAAALLRRSCDTGMQTCEGAPRG